ncbi:exported hypothetical protein [Rhodococcus ruber]|uniref:Uncharacterized protein n=1 Tax=Rhodococcus ruber TaxID=1830 RepID=A0A098BN79_9NOCA|nr:hypothetical protein EBESD8_56770 [Rhodococcus aetherivorans]CDZ89672.1 exported hypothetical protein [Rhodococcus ruber]
MNVIASLLAGWMAVAAAAGMFGAVLVLRRRIHPGRSGARICGRRQRRDHPGTVHPCRQR